MSVQNEKLQLIQGEKPLVFRPTDVPSGSETRDLRDGVRSTLVKLLVLLYSRRHEDVTKVAA
jgi:hypothetical protein